MQLTRQSSMTLTKLVWMILTNQPILFAQQHMLFNILYIMLLTKLPSIDAQQAICHIMPFNNLSGMELTKLSSMLLRKLFKRLLVNFLIVLLTMFSTCFSTPSRYAVHRSF